MEAKKNPKYDLERKRGMFLNIGFVVALALVISAFEWRVEETAVTISPTDIDNEELIDIIATIHEPPPPKPKVIPEIIEELPEDAEEDDDLVDLIDNDFIEDDIIPEVPIPEDEPEEIEGIHVVVEDQPEPANGIQGFYKFISKNLKYPKNAKRLGIEGKVFVQFVVDKDGSLTDIQAMKGIGGGCDEEAVRVFKKAAKWKPGRQRGRPVKVRMIMPIVFQLK